MNDGPTTAQHRQATLMHPCRILGMRILPEVQRSAFGCVCLGHTLQLLQKTSHNLRAATAMMVMALLSHKWDTYFVAKVPHAQREGLSHCRLVVGQGGVGHIAYG